MLLSVVNKWLATAHNEAHRQPFASNKPEPKQPAQISDYGNFLRHQYIGERMLEAFRNKQDFVPDQLDGYRLKINLKKLCERIAANEETMSQCYAALHVALRQHF